MPFRPNIARQRIQLAIWEFLSAEKNLRHLQRGKVERTCANDLAAVLKSYFETDVVSVDSPYNKHRDAAKYLGKDLIEVDIAIHERGEDRNNLVAIELETSNNPKCDDIWKLEGLTLPPEGYGYELGLFIVLGVQRRAGQLLAFEWFAKGKRL